MGYINKQGTIKSVIQRLKMAGCVFAEEEAQLLISEAETLDELFKMVDKRVLGLPIEHILGWADFCGIRIDIATGVFVPRRRTEFLVEKAADCIFQGGIVVDLCCGSGAVGVAIAKAVGCINLYATDIDPIAVQCAQRNISKINGQVYEGDLYNPLPVKIRRRVDMIVANAPYVPTESIKFLPQDFRNHESRIALDGGDDGLSIQRRVVSESSVWLAQGGHILVETSKLQAHRTIEIFTQNGFSTRLEYNAELDAYIVIGEKA